MTPGQGWFEDEHPEAARWISLGEDVVLYAIDEETDTESRRFVARVEEIRRAEPPIIGFLARSSERSELEPVEELLRKCQESGSTLLHIESGGEVVLPVGATAIRTYSPPLVLEVVAPPEDESTLVIVQVASTGEAAKESSTFYLQFFAKLLD